MINDEMKMYKDVIKEFVECGDSNYYICQYINYLAIDGDITWEQCNELHNFLLDYVLGKQK